MKDLIINSIGGGISMLSISGIIYLLLPESKIWLFPLLASSLFFIVVPLMILYVSLIDLVCDKIKHIHKQCER